MTKTLHFEPHGEKSSDMEKNLVTVLHVLSVCLDILSAFREGVDEWKFQIVINFQIVPKFYNFIMSLSSLFLLHFCLTTSLGNTGISGQEWTH